jgi:hypothetical protein
MKMHQKAVLFGGTSIFSFRKVSAFKYCLPRISLAARENWFSSCCMLSRRCFGLVLSRIGYSCLFGACFRVLFTVATGLWLSGLYSVQFRLCFPQKKGFFCGL